MAAPAKKKTPGDALIAIDFGTQYSRVACLRGEDPVLLADSANETEIPSALLLSEGGGMLAGVDARAHQAIFPRETVLALKSLLTADVKDLQARGGFFPHAVTAGLGQMAQLEVGGRKRTALELVALYLSHLRRHAEVSLERPVAGAVMTVPPGFLPFDRRALRVAARLAGFQHLRLIDEPVAVGLAGLAQGVRGRIVACSWGAGHFGAAILELQEELVWVVAVAGSDQIGGEGLEHALARDFLERVRQGDPGAMENEANVARHVLAGAQRVVREIATAGKAELALRLRGRERPVRHVYGAADLEAWLEPARRTVTALAEQLLADAGIKRIDLDAVLLGGGMVRLPAAREHLEALFGRRAPEGPDPGEAAVRGALLRARFLDHELTGPLVLDALPAAIGLQGQSGQVAPLLARGEIIPASRTELFTTYLERQTEVGVPLFALRGAQWEPLAQVEITHLPSLKDGQPQIEVAFAVDEDGALAVEAREITKSKALTVDVRPRRGLSASQAASLVQELPPAEDGGFPERLREELRERGRLLLGTVRGVAKSHPGLMTRDEKHLIVNKTQGLEETLEGSDANELRTAIRELNEAAQPLLQRVLDKDLEALLR